MESFEYKIQVPVGIHVRNALLLSQSVMQYQSSIILHMGARSADAKKLMDVMLLRIRCGDEIYFTIEGTDERDACLAVRDFCEKNL